jgi:predicted Zn finger-like uncharacterized protein
MLALPCPQCGRRFKVKEEVAGRKVRCPHCVRAVAVPAALPVGPAPGRGNEAPTLAPEGYGARAAVAGGDTRSDADPLSGPSLTDAPYTGQSRPGLADFLAPPEGPGELGRLGPYRVLRVLGGVASHKAIRPAGTGAGQLSCSSSSWS